MDKKKNLIKWGIGIFLFLIVSVNMFFSIIGPLYSKGYKFIKPEEDEAVYALPPIEAGDEIRQSFIVDKDIQSVEFATGTFGNQYTEGYLEVGVCEKGNPDNFRWKQVSLSKLTDNGRYLLKLEPRIMVEKETEYELVVRGTGMLKGQQIALMGVDGGVNRGECRLNGAVVGGAALMNVYIRSKLSIALTAVFWFLMALLCAAFFIALRKKNLKEHVIYLFLAVVLGIGYMFVFPMGTVPDEFAHYNTARYYSDRLMGIEQRNGGIFRNEENATVAYLTKRQGDREFDYSSMTPDMSAYGWQYSGSFFRSSDPEIVWEEEPAVVTRAFPGLYTGAVAGITLARLLRLGDTLMVYMGRLLQYALSVFLTYMAIRLSPRFKRIFLITAILPMTMHLSVSYSYDATVIALAMFYVALCLKYTFSEKAMIWKDALLIIAAGGFLAPGKVVYLPVCFLCLIIPSEKFKNKRAAWIIKAAVLAVSLGMFLFFCWGNVARYTNPQGIISTKYSVGSALNDFPGFVHIIITTIWKRADLYFRLMLGGFLGYFNIEIPISILMAFTLLLVWAVRREQITEEDDKHLFRLSVVGLAISAVVTMLIFATGYTWTDIGETVLNGLQGRYWLPVLPLFLMSIRLRKQKAVTFNDSQVTAVVLALHAMVLFTSMAVILGR